MPGVCLPQLDEVCRGLSCLEKIGGDYSGFSSPPEIALSYNSGSQLEANGQK